MNTPRRLPRTAPWFGGGSGNSHPGLPTAHPVSMEKSVKDDRGGRAEKQTRVEVYSLLPEVLVPRF